LPKICLFTEKPFPDKMSSPLQPSRVLVQPVQLERYRIESIDMHPDNETIVMGTTSGHVVLWDAKKRTKRWEKCFGHDVPKSVAFSPDGSKVAIGVNSGRLYIRLTIDDSRLHSIRTAQYGNLRSVAFSPDGNQLIASYSAHPRGSITNIWTFGHVPTARLLRRDHGAIVSVAFSPDGRRYATADRYTPLIRVWSIEDGKQVQSIVPNPLYLIETISFSPNGRYIIATYTGVTAVYIWSVESGLCVHRLGGFDHHIVSAKFSKDGNEMLVFLSDGTANDRMTYFMVQTVSRYMVHPLILDEICRSYGLPGGKQRRYSVFWEIEKLLIRWR